LPPEDRAAQVGALQRQILGFQIQGAVFERLADEEGIEVDDADLDQARERLLEAVGGQQQLDQVLAQEGLTPTLLEELILPQEVRLAELAEVVGGGAAQPDPGPGDPRRGHRGRPGARGVERRGAAGGAGRPGRPAAAGRPTCGMTVTVAPRVPSVLVGEPT
jgi:hypothetical protein